MGRRGESIISLQTGGGEGGKSSTIKSCIGAIQIVCGLKILISLLVFFFIFIITHGGSPGKDRGNRGVPDVREIKPPKCERTFHEIQVFIKITSGLSLQSSSPQLAAACIFPALSPPPHRSSSRLALFLETIVQHGVLFFILVNAFVQFCSMCGFVRLEIVAKNAGI